MPRCENCKRKTHILTDCKWCVGSMCVSCLAVETHNCKNIEQMKEYYLKNLEQKLVKTVGAKVIKI
jgi:hypothetical protein